MKKMTAADRGAQVGGVIGCLVAAILSRIILMTVLPPKELILIFFILFALIIWLAMGIGAMIAERLYSHYYHE